VTTLAEVLLPVSTEEVKALLLETLQGIGPVQQLGVGAGVVVPSGSPLASYDVLLEITTAGTLGTGAFRYSLDGGATFTVAYTIPAGGTHATTGSGLNFTFAGDFDQGDQYVFQTVYPPFSVTDWESGGAARTLVEADAATLADLVGTALPNIAAGGLVSYASGDWLTLLSSEMYLNDRYAAGATMGVVLLVLGSNAADLTVAAGELVLSNSSGSGAGVVLFSNVAGFTLVHGTSAVIAFQAEQPGAAYNVQNGVLTVLKTPRPGLTASNPAPGTSAVSHSGGGTGTVVPSGSPLGNFSVVVRVTTSGGLGAGAFQVSLDGGVNYASPLAVPGGGTYAVTQLDGLTATGLTLTFAGTFTSGDTYAFVSYASWVTTPGLDEEADAALRARDTGQWSALGVGGGTAATFDWLCRQAPGGGSEVAKTSVEVDAVVGGQVNVTVAGVNGPVSTSALTAVAAFVRARLGICASAVISNSGTSTLALTGQVFVGAQQLAGAQASISAALLALATQTPIGGTVFWSDIEDALSQKASGVRNVYLTSPTPNTDTDLPAHNVVVFDASGISYVLL
jgi:hypothetical protein